MEQFTYQITEECGLHARPAGGLVKLAGSFTSKLTVEKEGKPAMDAKRLFSVMTLGARKGDEIKITAEGADASQALEALQSYCIHNL